MGPLKATEDQKRFAEYILTDTAEKWRGRFDGNPYQRQVSITAEILVTDILHLPRREKTVGFDGGFDILYRNQKWDIKTNIRTVNFKRQFYDHVVLESQIPYDCYGYIFVSFNKLNDTYYISGFMSKKEFLEKARLYKKGESRPRTDGSLCTYQEPTYVIPARDTYPFFLLLNEREEGLVSWL